MFRDLRDIIAQHPFFRELSEEHLAVLVGCATNQRYAAGEFLFRQGETARHFYLVRQGKVAIEVVSPQQGTITVQTLGEGEVVGWSWLVPPYEYRFDARAAELTRVVALDGECLRGKFTQDHELGYRFLSRFVQVIAERLEHTRLQLLDLYK